MKFKKMLKAKSAALLAIYELAESEGRDLTEEERQSAKALEGEIKALEKTIADKEALDKRISEQETEEKTPVNTAPLPPVDMSTQEKKEDDGGFKTMGEFVHSVRFNPADGRLKDLAREMPKAEKDVDAINTGDYAFLMPPHLLSTIREMDLAGPSIVRPRATVFPAGSFQPDAAIQIPMVDQLSDDSNIFGGVEVQWIDEGEFKPETTKKLTSVTITPYELAASMRITDKTLRNFPALEPLFRRNLFAALNYAEDLAFLRGTGDDGTPKQPTGLFTSDAIVEVPRAIAGKFGYDDAVNMLSRVLARSGAVWVIDSTLMIDVYTMQDPSGSYIYGPADAALGRPETLLGRPIIWTDRTAQSGAPAAIGSVLLADFSYYGIKDGYGPAIAASPHPYFQNNVTVIKVFNNVGGKSMISGPIKQLNGKEVSPYVALGPVTP